jgi:predicted nucleic acid-binding protein
MPEEPRLVVVNTTPIIALSLIGELDLLRSLSSATNSGQGDHECQDIQEGHLPPLYSVYK